MKRLLAEQFSDMEVLTSAFGGKDGSSLITDRNAALSVLNLELQKGERSLAIFYGAAHMGFDQRLRKEFNLEPIETVGSKREFKRPCSATQIKGVLTRKRLYHYLRMWTGLRADLSHIHTILNIINILTK